VVALQLAQDRRHGVGLEAHTALAVEPVDGVDQTDARHLREVFDRLPRVLVTAGQTLGERHEALDQLLAHACFVPASKQLVRRCFAIGRFGHQHCEVNAMGTGPVTPAVGRIAELMIVR
jgi:hypothetical protein